ncbi:MAG: hypothetical protein WCQ60_00760 [bacterium]
MKTFFWIVTVCLCLIMSVTHEAQAASTSNVQSSLQSTTTTTNVITSGNTSGGVKPNSIACLWGALLLFLVLAGIVLWAVWLICKAARLCGNTGNQPPAGGQGGLANVVVASSKTTMKASGGLTLASGQSIPDASALGMIPFPLEINGVVVSADRVESDVLPSNVALWCLTNGIADDYFDTNDWRYPYVGVCNYSILTSTNLVNWDCHTIVSWMNNNPINPLICQIVYTNHVTYTGTNQVTTGIAISTNWIKFFFDKAVSFPGATVTNRVIYGTPMVLPNHKPPQLYVWLWANTNQIMTTGPSRPIIR